MSAQKSAALKVDSTKVVVKQFDATKIDTYKNDKDFIYKVTTQPSLYQKFKEWVSRVLRKIMSWFFDDVEAPVGFILSFLRALPYIIAVVVLYLIINFFLKVSTRNGIVGTTNKKVVKIDDDEELLNSQDLPKLIDLAIKEKDYRLAVRYQYVLLLQQLTAKKIIEWEQQKTNEDYIKEVQKENIHQEFESITRFYDFVWYGNFNINLESYNKGVVVLEKLTAKIQ